MNQDAGTDFENLFLNLADKISGADALLYFDNRVRASNAWRRILRHYSGW